MTDLPDAIRLLDAAPAQGFHDLVVLTYDERILRRKRLTTVHGESFLVDLPATTSLDPYAGFELADGRAIEIVAAEESLLEVTGDLPRIAWHIGNRHTPCQIEDHRLLIRADHVLEAMLRQLGAQVARISEPFTPEGGAYGHGRTMGHSHGPEVAHVHAHSAGHSHSHPHGHAHAHAHAVAGSTSPADDQRDGPF